MGKIYDNTPTIVINKAADQLKDQLKQPEWSFFVKTGHGRERVPSNKDWYHQRAASILRTVAVRGPIGVSKLAKKYGNKKNRGHAPEKFAPAGRKIIRTILQQFEQLGFIEKKKIGAHHGRKVTSRGQSFLDKVAK